MRALPFVSALSALSMLAISSLSTSILAAPAVRSDYPCKGCLFLPPPEGSTKTPLLVVLHGDAPGGKTPLVKRDSEPFVSAASERGIAVFAPMCPKEEGCSVGSYWQWSQGDPPAWIAAQMDKINKDYSLDSERTWIAGWSGGASFLGYHYQRLAKWYGAVIFAGGGIPPASDTCSRCSPPAYFLVGDKNPLHHLAKSLRTSVSACTQDVTWDLQPGKDHAGEWRALNQKTKLGELFDWLAKHPRNCLPENPASAPVVSASTMPISSAVPEVKSIASAPAVKPQPVPPKRSGCAMGNGTTSGRESWVIVMLVLLGFTMRRTRMVSFRQTT